MDLSGHIRAASSILALGVAICAAPVAAQDTVPRLPDVAPPAAARVPAEPPLSV
jgi:hypothetical protein